MTELELLQTARQAAAATYPTEVGWCRAVHIGYNYWCILRRGGHTPTVALLMRAGDLAGLTLGWTAQAAPCSTQTAEG